MSPLSSKQKSSLRSEAQTLKPTLIVGKQGLQQGVIAELQKAFSKFELIKIAFKADRTAIDALVAEIENATESECVGGVGKRRIFYRQLPEVAE